eukprot:scaffold29670_cov153-Skeletonema_marinoi.AAC.1
MIVTLVDASKLLLHIMFMFFEFLVEGGERRGKVEKRVGTSSECELLLIYAIQLHAINAEAGNDPS